MREVSNEACRYETHGVVGSGSGVKCMGVGTGIPFGRFSSPRMQHYDHET